MDKFKEYERRPNWLEGCAHQRKEHQQTLRRHQPWARNCTQPFTLDLSILRTINEVGSFGITRLQRRKMRKEVTQQTWSEQGSNPGSPGRQLHAPDDSPTAATPRDGGRGDRGRQVPEPMVGVRVLTREGKKVWDQIYLFFEILSGSPRGRGWRQGSHQKPSDSGSEQDGGRGTTQETEVGLVGQDFIQRGAWPHRQDLQRQWQEERRFQLRRGGLDPGPSWARWP